MKAAKPLPNEDKISTTRKATTCGQKERPTGTATPAPEYQPTEKERAALESYKRRDASTMSLPKLKVSKEKPRSEPQWDHPDQKTTILLVAEAFGSNDPHFLKGLVGQVNRSCRSRGDYDEDSINFVLSVINGVKPRDRLEAILAAQIANLHMAAMRAAEHLNNAANPEQRDSAERVYYKLVRNLIRAIDALKRYRRGRELNLNVQNASINDNGQAVVAQVTQASPEEPRSDRKRGGE